MALYQKLRPGTFDEVLGNEAAVAALKTNLTKPSAERPHVYGLVGPSGCGKTTLARIAAKVLGAGELSLFEINASDTRGIDTAREIADKMKFTTLDGSPQVWIIDECHKATSDFWNCLLKPLEDTPAHVYVFLCTTEGAKIPAAVKTRTKIINVEAQKEDALRKWLIRTANKNEIAVDRAVIELISEVSNGSPRQALQHLESVVGMDPEMARKVVLSGNIDEPEVKNLSQMLIKQTPWKDVAAQLKLLKDKDAEGLRRAILGYCNAILLNGKADAAVAGVLEIMASANTYDSGLPGFTLLCYQANQSHQG